MARQVWLCDKRETPFLEEEAAQQCETSHCPETAIKVVGFEWGRGDWKRQWAPNAVVLSIQEKMSNNPLATSVVKYFRK